MSNGLSSNLEQLDALLSGDTVGDNAMGLSELDGFLAGMIVCPAVVMPQEWIRQVWGEDGLNVDNVDDIEAANALVMARFKQLIAKLDQGAYAPVYDIDQLEQVVWPTWSGGFLRAMALRPEAWHQFGDIGGEDAQHAMFTMMRLCELGNMSEDDVDVSFEMDQHLIAVAPDLIPEAVQLLYSAKKAEGKTIPASLAEREMKVGRNDPCPCGSGKKYKNCCLNAA